MPLMPKQYIPHRNDIIFLDFEPTKVKKIGKYRPALVLSAEEYNRKTGLLICCPISTSARGSLTEVPIDSIDNAESVVAASIVQTMSWQARKVKFIAKAKPHVLEDVLLRLLPLIGADKLFDSAD